MKTGSNDSNNEFDHASEPEVERGLSAVAAAPAKSLAIMGVLGLIILATLWYAFFAPTKEEKEKAAKKPVVEVSNKIATSKPAVADLEPKVTSLPALPAPPPLVTPTPPPPPPPPVESKPSANAAVVEPIIKEEDPINDVKDGQLSARLKTPMVLGGGSGGGTGSSDITGKGDEKGGGGVKGLFGSKGVANIANNGSFTPEATSSDQVQVTRIGEMGAIIAQGKIIDAILETALNTDLPGTLRALISRDVYAESGKRVLIPKGSRLIGTYEVDVKVGQRRVNIIWTRVILPSGIDVKIDSPATDQLGRAGIEGLVDNKFKELLTSAILVSTISTGFAVAAQNLTGSGEGTTTTTTGSSGTTTTSTTDATQTAIAGAIQQMGTVGQSLTQQLINTKPTITIDQGSRIKVFVNRDLIFPNDLADNVKFVR